MAIYVKILFCAVLEHTLRQSLQKPETLKGLFVAYMLTLNAKIA